MSAGIVIEKLAEDLPQLYLDPDKDSADCYKRIVLRGEEPETKCLGHYTGDPGDRDETAETPAGPVRVVTLGNRKDFELVLRGLMAARNGPLAEIPESQGAAMLTVFNWNRIKAHLASFPEDEQAAEFKRFTSVKENYTDMLIVLSRGPYSGVRAEEAGFGQAEWLEISDTIRRYHELTHVICRRLYSGRIDAVKDEVVADAVGIYAALGHYDPDLAGLFLGVRDGEYTGGRLGNYADEPERLAVDVNKMIKDIQKLIEAQAGAEPVGLIPIMMGAE
ncbi:MAG: hypothetical protein IJM62_05085 [Lachnospiraceae bacterium]|nr:hypothetical protein [Lachnospiraceae bacterium]